MAEVRYEVVYAADVAVVMGALVDEAFLAAYAEQMGAPTWDVAVDRSDELIRTRLRMTVPTRGIPAVFSRFVPATIGVVEKRSWPRAPGQGERRGSVAVDAAVGKRDARVRGDVSLAAVADGTRFSMAGTIAVNVPLVGDRAGELVKDLILRVLGDQTEVMNRWIAR